MKKTVSIKILFLFLVSSSLFLNSCGTKTKKIGEANKTVFDVVNIKAIKNRRNISQKWTTDTSKHIVPLDEFAVLLKRNDIKPLNNPNYINNNEAKDSLFGGQPVIAVEINGESRCYPLNMLSYHEIVNDSIGNTFFSVAYCPLCNTAYVFNRKLKYKKNKYLLKFGTTGMLRMSNLVMWDEQTETWWQHINGKGLVGRLSGAKLTVIPAKIMSLNNYCKFYPNGKTLMPKKDKNYETHYDINNYVKYDSIGIKKPFLFFKKVDNRLPAMDYVISVEKNDLVKVYPLNKLKKLKVINDKIGKNNIVIFYNSDMISNLDTKEIKNGKQIGSGTVFNASVDNKKLTFVADKDGFKDKKTGSLWNFIGECTNGKLKGKTLIPQEYGLDFAFAYLAFNPKAVVFSVNKTN